MFSFPNNALASVSNNTTTLFNDMWWFVGIIIAIPFGFWILNTIIDTIVGRGKREDKFEEEAEKIIEKRDKMILGHNISPEHFDFFERYNENK